MRLESRYFFSLPLSVSLSLSLSLSLCFFLFFSFPYHAFTEKRVVRHRCLLSALRNAALAKVVAHCCSIGR